MSEKTNLTRRDFLKALGAAGSAAIASSLFPLPVTQAATSAERFFADEYLQGVSDIHIHAAPDVKERAIDELNFARQAKRAGYRSIMYKSNEWSCHDRVYLIRQVLPDFEVFGSLCMNRVHGDRVNAYAARMAVQTSGNYCRCIWMPTLASAYQCAYEKRSDKGIPVLSDTGKVLPEVVEVMEICAEADIIFATGHCSPEESIILAKKAKEIGVGKFVVTHASTFIWKMTPDQIKRIIDLGGWIEYSFLANLWGSGTGLPTFDRISGAEFAAYAQICPEQSFITTDLGQVRMPNPLAGMRSCIETLLQEGVSKNDIDLMIKVNPAKLMGLSS